MQAASIKTRAIVSCAVGYVEKPLGAAGGFQGGPHSLGQWE